MLTLEQSRESEPDHEVEVGRPISASSARKRRRVRTTHLLIGFLLIAYLVAKPFYVFSSGLPQIADMIAILIFGIALLGRIRLNRSSRSVLALCFGFSAYAVVVNLICWITLANPLGDFKPIVSGTIYIFNTMLVFAVLVELNLSGILIAKCFSWGIALSIWLQAVASFGIGGGGKARATLFFNNPNQLGYWALISATLFLVFQRRVRWRFVLQVPVILAAFYLVALSLSKAAALSFFLLLVLHYGRSIFQFLAAGVCAVALFMVMENTPVVEKLSSRLLSIGEQSDDSVEGRGYARIWEHPEYLFFGAGEGGLERFPNESFEMHSTLGTILFSYGLIGLGIFSCLIWKIFRFSNFQTFLLLFPALFYGVAHQGLRSTLFWLLIVVIGVMDSVLAEASGSRALRHRSRGFSTHSLQTDADE